MGTGQKSSDDEVSEFGILSKKEVTSKNKMSECLTFSSKNAYIACVERFCLITVPNVEESGEFGGNFHNRHGSYLSWTARSIVVNGEFGT